MGNAEACCSCNDGPAESGQGPVIVTTVPVIENDKQEKELLKATDARVEPALAKEEARVAKPEVSDELTPDTYEFTIKLKRNEVSEPWGFGMKTAGLTKSPAEQQLLVMNPGGKCLEEWEKANPNFTVQTLDEMIQVNGEVRIDKMVSMLKVSVEAEITLRRQARIHIKVTKRSGSNLGARLKSGTLEVEEVVDGPIGTYNKACVRSRQIVVGDQLVGINGKTMEAKDLLQALGSVRDGDDVTLTFGRKGNRSGVRAG